LPSEAPLPSCLDQTIRDQLGAELEPRGVQKRDFQKDNKLVLGFSGGLYGGDLTSSSWIAGGSLGYFFTEDFGLQAEFAVTPIELDLDSPLAQFFEDSRFEPGLAYIALANFVWSPIHAKLKLGGGIVHADFLLFAGGGRTIHDAVQGLSFDAGFALDMFVTRALTVRLEARDLMSIVEAAGETRYTNNLIATAGFAIYIPTGL
jgi:outer membrane beta-barrel protein